VRHDLNEIGNAKKPFEHGAIPGKYSGHWAMSGKYSGIAWAFPSITCLALFQRVSAGRLRNLIPGKAIAFAPG
jgi:hypothetical protein